MIYMMYKKLVGDCTAKSCLEDVRITKSQFADSMAVYSSNNGDLCSSHNTVCQHFGYMGTITDTTKTKELDAG